MFANTCSHISNASSTKYIARGISTDGIPLKFGAISDITTSTFSSPTRSSKVLRTFSSRKSPCRKSTPTMGSISKISHAITRPFRPIWLTTYCDQPPGAAPRSTTVIPGLNKRSVCWISSSLKYARERSFCLCAFCTKGSLKCSFNQRVELAERFFLPITCLMFF